MARNFERRCPPQFQLYKSENRLLLMPLTYMIGRRGQFWKFWKFFPSPFHFFSFLSFQISYVFLNNLYWLYRGMQLILWSFSFYLVNVEQMYKIVGIKLQPYSTYNAQWAKITEHSPVWDMLFHSPLIMRSLPSNCSNSEVKQNM